MSILRRSRGTAAAWTAIATVLVVLQHVSARVTRDSDYQWGVWKGVKNYVGGWAQFDGLEYLHIAQDGYWYRPASRAPVVFFPLYALVIRALDQMINEPVVTGVVVSAIAGLTAALLYRRWLDVAGVAAKDRHWALAVFLIYPYGWYLYGAIYSDGLFVALVIGALLLVEADRLAWAGVVGALATATRPTGMALVAALAVLTLERNGVLITVARPTWPGWVTRLGIPTGIDKSKLTRRMAWPLVSIAGVVSYSVYLGIRWGNPLLWATSQSEYSGSGPKTWLKAGFIARWIEWDDPVYTLTITAQALILLGVFVTAPMVGRRFGWGYATLVVSLGIIPCFSSRDFLGVGRYVLAAFPTAALVGERLANRRVARVAWVGVCAIALVTMNMAFSRSRMLS